MTGTLSMSRTLLNYRAGGRHRSSGILAGIICLLTLAFGTQALGFIPVPILGGLLLQLGADLLYDWLVKGWDTMQRPDYVQMAVIFLVIVAWDFVAGVALGVIAACITFAFNTSRLRLVRLGLNRSVYSGRVDRPAYQQEQLVLHGHCIQIMWLHSFVFFGSAHRLLLQLEEMIKAQNGSCRSLILDFRHVLGIDSSAVMSFIKLRQIADREGFTLVLSEMPKHVAHALQVGGLIGDGDNHTCRVFTNTDGALEWCEDKLLDEMKASEGTVLSADNWLASEIGSDQMFTRLTNYLELVKCQTGDLLIRQGEEGDSLYLLFAGRVTVLFRTAEGVDLRLRSMVGHTIVGEMGLYRTLPRGASVRADHPTVAYRMTRDALARMEKDDPDLAYAFHKLVIRTLAARLDFSNREVASLQR
jgi:SulP family sulfate permease